MRYRLAEIPPGELGTDRTVDQIKTFIQASLRSTKVRLLALTILRTSGVSARDGLAVAQLLTDWVRRHIRFVPDPRGVETVQSPEITLKLQAGDCDDHVGLVSALLESVGIKTRMKVIGVDRDSFEHIFVEALVGGQWRPFDSTLPLGVTPRGFGHSQKTYTVQEDSVMSNIRGPATAGRVTVSDLKRAVYESARAVIQKKWQAGKITPNDLVSYLSVARSKDSPSYGTLAHVPMVKAIEDFLRVVDQVPILKTRTMSSLSGSVGLTGFLDDVWGGVKTGVGEVVKYGGQIFGTPSGQSSQPYSIQPTVQVQASLPPQAAAAGAQALLTSPTFIGLSLVGLAIYLTTRKARR